MTLLPRPLKVSPVIAQMRRIEVVHLTKKASDLAYGNTDTAAWGVEPDQVEISIGRSSADIQLKQSLEVNSAGGVAPLLS